jgi:hypothetical protein
MRTTTGEGENQAMSAERPQESALAALRRFARSPRADVERCELCGIDLAGEHPHLLDRRSRQVACSCDACAILFCAQEDAKFVRIPRRVVALDNLAFDEGAWDALMLPINLAFFLRGSDDSTAAAYPSPAGVMASEIALPAWSELFASSATLQSVVPEVEALLVNRLDGQASSFLVPVDECYRLVGLVRTQWHGLSGGPDLWNAVREFFARVQRRSSRVGASAHA